jgi:hypothetical protein
MLAWTFHIGSESLERNLKGKIIMQQTEQAGAHRRNAIKRLGALPLIAWLPTFASAQAIDIPSRKEVYKQRMKKILAGGVLPFIDLESSCDSTKVDIEAVAKLMDELNIGLMALSADIGEGQYKKGVIFDDLSARLDAAYPDRFIPVGNGGQGPALLKSPDQFLDGQEQALNDKKILLLGEYEFRHYMSPRQFKRGETERNIKIPIDGGIGQRVFAMSEKTGAAFQLHYEIEDELLPPLESMLEKYPGAKVVWCHLAQIRYSDRASRYSPTYVEGLIKRFPNLSFDTAFGDARSVYKPSHERQSKIWSSDGTLKKGWTDLMVAYPNRFLSALDLGGDRMDRMAEYSTRHRAFLQYLPPEIQHQVAYMNAWTLLFGETFA